MKEKIKITPVLALSDLQQPFEIETNASGYAMGAVLMQHKNQYTITLKPSLKQ